MSDHPELPGRDKLVKVINLAFEVFLLRQESRNDWQEIQRLSDEAYAIWYTLPEYQRNIIQQFASNLKVFDWR